MSTYSTALVFFRGIPYHKYHHDKTVTDPSLRLKIIIKHLCNVSFTVTIVITCCGIPQRNTMEIPHFDVIPTNSLEQGPHDGTHSIQNM